MELVSPLPAHFYVDALSTLLQSPWKQSGLVRALNTLAIDRQVVVHWIPAHSGNTGNELADQVAKKATEAKITAPEPFLPVSADVIQDAIKTWGRETHLRRWMEGADCADTKKIIKTTNKSIAEYCRGLSRESLRILTMIITGHCLLA